VNLRRREPGGFLKKPGPTLRSPAPHREMPARRQVLLPLSALHPGTQADPGRRMARSMGIYYSA